MSSRQIRRLKEMLNEEIDEEIRPRVIFNNKRPKFTFAQLESLCDSSSDTTSNDDSSENSDDSSENSDDSEYSSDYDRIRESRSAIYLDGLSKDDESSKDPSEDNQSSEHDSDWDKLLNEVTEVEMEPIDSSETVSNHFLCSPQHFFRISDMGKNKYAKSNGYSSRFWLCPTLNIKESKQLRLAASNLFEITCETIDNRDKFTLTLFQTYYPKQYYYIPTIGLYSNIEFYRYQELDYISSTALDSHDLELFRTLLHSNPYHLGILIRASLINTMMNSHEDSFKNLYTASKTLQTILPHRFNLYRTAPFSNLTVPNVYLPCLGDNVVVYRILILYMISLERKGQWKTALAICKLLLAMDLPNDSSHALLHVDLYLLNSFSPDSSLILFSQNHSPINPELPPLYLFLPNFSLTLSLQVYLNMGLKNQCNLEEIKNQLPGVLDLGCDLAALARTETPNTPYLLLIRSLLQFPLFVINMSQRVGKSGELRNSAKKDPFSYWSSPKAKDYENVYDQLTRCYVYKCGDLWSSNNSTFLAETAKLVVKLYEDEEVRDLINQFQCEYFEFRNGIKIPEEYTNISITEFDLNNYSLPMLLDFQS
uniref:Transcriptional repressor TCF25, putative n=1 Tax=Theileria annulata TaxID=5874 RepID=A0A3B0MJN6_THEAN